MKYEISRNWNVFTENDKLFISRGADEIYYLDEATVEQARKIQDAYDNNFLDSLMSDHDYDEIIGKLEKVGVIYEKKFAPSNGRIKLYIKYYGKPSDEIRDEIARKIKRNKNIKLVDRIEDSDLALLVRINVPLRTLLKDYSKIEVPHIFVDLGYANNISIGPIVFEGVACLGCFIGRISKNWGDAPPPVEPAVMDKFELISAFILDRVEEFMVYGNCLDLVNGVWNYNVSTHCSGYNKVFKLPWCPYCGSGDDNPRIDLPWVRELGNE